MKHQLYVHVKSGKTYRLIGAGRIEANMSACAIYTDHPDGENIWVRPHLEFFDGRFQPVGEWDDGIFNPLGDIADFHEKFDLPPAEPMGALNQETMNFRYKFLQEELNEWYKGQVNAWDISTAPVDYRDEADYNHHLEQALDGLVDLAYVLFGTVLLHGFSPVFAEAWSRVHHANMQKVRADLVTDSKRQSTLDVVKPAGWEPPKLTDLVEDNDIHNPFPDRV